MKNITLVDNHYFSVANFGPNQQFKVNVSILMTALVMS